MIDEEQMLGLGLVTSESWTIKRKEYLTQIKINVLDDVMLGPSYVMHYFIETDNLDCI